MKEEQQRFLSLLGQLPARLTAEQAVKGSTHSLVRFSLPKTGNSGVAAVMPRKIRVEYGGAIYHVMSRGDRREDIYLDDVDRQDYLKTLAEACQKTGFQVHAYCLMRNHFHLVIETPNERVGS